jgi:hypothetical protein
MKLWNKLFPRKEVRSVRYVLDDIGENFPGGGFRVIRDATENGIHSYPKGVSNIIANGETAQVFVHKTIVSLAGEYLESGKYHEHWGDRGILSPVGEEMLSLFDHSIDYLRTSDIIVEPTANEQKEIVRENIMLVG